ncbi:MAG: carboxylesterase/lipase family protein, partial [Acidimicrobiales bacterium]
MSAPVVELSAGRIAGTSDGGVLIFRGIPYAGSPAGARRFGPPLPVVPWTGLRQATSYGPTAVQPPPPPARLDGGAEIPQGEDCLVLNVWTTGLTGARPVLFWIHGGGFSTGSGSAPWYDGSALAARGDVVVVTVNHRLGLLGFLDLAELAGDALADSANAGMLDLIAALRWVRGHIASFGGDPGRVTIFGESGGGGKVATLLAMPDAAGLFHRAAIQSGIFRGGPGQLLQGPERAAAIAHRVVAELGSVDELRRAPAARLLEIQRAVEAERTPGTASVMAFCPTVDGRVVTDHPQAAVAAGASAEVPLIIGTNRDEVTLFLWLSDEAFRADPLGWSPDDDTLAARLAGSCGGRTVEIVEQYRA